MVYRKDAARYEAGTANLACLAGFKSALELLTEAGIDAIAAELLRKRAWLVPELLARGYTVLHADCAQENAGGIVSFYRPDSDIAAIHEKLEQHQIITSLRSDRSGQNYIRLSPHFYNTDEELQKLLLLL